MWDDTSSPEEDESRHYDLWESPIRADERYDCDKHEAKTPENIHDGVVFYFYGKEKEENVWDEENEVDGGHSYNDKVYYAKGKKKEEDKASSKMLCDREQRKPHSLINNKKVLTVRSIPIIFVPIQTV